LESRRSPPPPAWLHFATSSICGSRSHRYGSERERLVRTVPGAGSPQGNFIYLKTREPSADVAEKMLERGVIIRDCRSFRDAGDDHIRVTVGTPRENDRFLEAYGEVC